jgi:archaellum component FlaC
MTDIKETLKKIKVLLSSEPPKVPAAPSAAPAAPAAPTANPVDTAKQYKLQDGTPVEIDKLEVGGIVTINGQPAPANEYVLEDGTNVTVDDKGTITEVESKQAEAIEPDDFKKQVNDKFTTLEAEFKTHKESFAAVQAEFNNAKELLGKQDQAIKGLLEVVEKLAKTPTADPVEETESFKTEKFEKKANKLDRIVEAIKEQRKEN